MLQRRLVTFSEASADKSEYNFNEDFAAESYQNMVIMFYFRLLSNSSGAFDILSTQNANGQEGFNFVDFTLGRTTDGKLQISATFDNESTKTWELKNADGDSIDGSTETLKNWTFFMVSFSHNISEYSITVYYEVGSATGQFNINDISDEYKLGNGNTSLVFAKTDCVVFQINKFLIDFAKVTQETTEYRTKSIFETVNNPTCDDFNCNTCEIDKCTKCRSTVAEEINGDESNLKCEASSRRIFIDNKDLSHEYTMNDILNCKARKWCDVHYLVTEEFAFSTSLYFGSYDSTSKYQIISVKNGCNQNISVYIQGEKLYLNGKDVSVDLESGIWYFFVLTKSSSGMAISITDSNGLAHCSLKVDSKDYTSFLLLKDSVVTFGAAPGEFVADEAYIYWGIPSMEVLKKRSENITPGNGCTSMDVK